MARQKKSLTLQENLHAHARRCDQPGCAQGGEYRAPQSRDSDAHYWFCLDHVRQYNAAWDFFSGMSADEIERYVRANATGQRPTWRIGTKASFDLPDFFVLDDLGLLGELKAAAQARRKKANGNGGGGAKSNADPRWRAAFMTLQLESDASLPQIKARFKQLVKRYHPDANGGDKRAEERLKTIIAAYSYLLGAAD